MKPLRWRNANFFTKFLDNRRYLFPFLLSLTLFLFATGQDSCIPPVEKPKPPEQPASGPGGAEYSHADVIENSYGEGNDQYWIFEPDSPMPQSAPLIIFIHAWGGMEPKIYEAWIHHIVLRGNIVVFPRYQESLRTPGRLMMGNVIKAVKAAIETLEGGGHVLPELDKVAVLGHSGGGVFAANFVVLANSEDLPVPKAFMSVEPVAVDEVFFEDFSKISRGILALVVVGAEDDITAGEDTATAIFSGSSQIPPSEKNFVTVLSDYYGEPPLVANHAAPTTFPSPDALDYYGFWKLFDGLTDAAFYNKNREYALGNTPQQRFMGYWSDGRPVKELIVTEIP